MRYLCPIYFFFLADASPNDEEKATLEKLPFPVVLRNSLAIAESDKPEKCDAVMGAVPAPYAHLPHAFQFVLDAIAGLDKSDAVEVADAPQKPARAPRAPKVAPVAPVVTDGQPPTWG